MNSDAAGDRAARGVLEALMQVIDGRRSASPDSSYVARLLHAGPERIREKIDEEARELVGAVSASAPRVGHDRVHEAADLVFHTLVLLAWSGVSLGDVESELARRWGTSGLVERENRGIEAGSP